MSELIPLTGVAAGALRARVSHPVHVQLEQFSEAGVGFFAEITGRSIRTRDWWRGFLTLERDSALLVILDERSDEERLHGPHWMKAESILGVTEHGSVLLTDITRRRGASAFGQQASAQRYWANALVAGPNLGDRTDSKFISVSFSVLGLQSWGGVSAAVEDWESTSDDKIKKATITLESTKLMGAPLTGGCVLEVRGGWGVSGTIDKRIMTAPMVFKVRSRRSKLLPDLIDPLYHVQDLLGLALNRRMGGHECVSSSSRNRARR